MIIVYLNLVTDIQPKSFVRQFTRRKTPVKFLSLIICEKC